ncbi:MAG: 5-formyltetrahydrofolate cyclo-ligase [Gammaproteobacteria bacterium]|nr:5-formyltetrahydrofolate cyclo-ligase [Gammaproteobacteria bacterium]
MPPSEKQPLRRFYRTARRSLSPDAQREHSLGIAAEVMRHLDDVTAVAAYLARDGEVDLVHVFKRCWRRRIDIAVPVIRGRDLRFAEYRCGERLSRNRFGIPEPAQPVFVTPCVVLTPLVAFDDSGRRLGMGGGYYDRYFAATATPARIGVAHECQRAPTLPATPSDVSLTAVVTENGWQSF